MKTAVAFLVFNRPECTARVFAAIRAARPPRLLVVADGPRPSRPEDSVRCAEVRRIIDEGVDWPCVVERNYAETNLGCAHRVAGGLDWAFARSEELIVLEDDCLPDLSFFPFCEELLVRYRHDTRIGQISGTPFIRTQIEVSDSYFFSRYGPIWGWASWRRAWEKYDLNLKSWGDRAVQRDIASVIFNPIERSVRSRLYDRLNDGKYSTWDYQWGYAKLTQSMLTAIPKESLIENIGIGSDATHTASAPQAALARGELRFPLTHPKQILPHAGFDAEFAIASCGSRIRRIAARLFTKICHYVD